ncbi:MAG: hypothetical protein A2V83_00535 [Nitrospirae bacterium RBG_16_64_22]|nr:MAG: hypothetical protein A2V83_00535 [Nitrospirae bacterium RBG_16_64_22]
MVVFLAGCATGPSQVERERKAQAHTKLGGSYMAEGKFQDAYVEFQKAIEINPQDKEAHNALGLLFEFQFVKGDEAEKAYRRAIEIDPGYSEAYNNLGVNLTRRKRFAEAKEMFQKAIQNPVYRTPDAAHFNLGLVHLEMKDKGEAKKAFREATRINPGYPAARLALAQLQFESGECQEVETGLREFLRFRPEFPGSYKAHYFLGMCYFKSGKGKEARASLEQALKLEPAAPEAPEARRILNLLR